MSAFTPFKTWIGTTVPAASTPDSAGAEKLAVIQSSATKSITLLALAQWLIRTALAFVQTAIASADAAIRTLAAKLSEHYSPEDFKNDDGTDVLGDGIQDDTTGLQKFLNFVLTNGKQGIATGTYRTTATIIFSGDKGSFFMYGSKIKPDASVLVAVQFGTTAAILGLGVRIFGLLCDREVYSGATENIGFLLKNITTCSLYDCSSLFSKYNWVARPDTNDRVAYNEFHHARSRAGFYNIWYDPQGTGFANGNNWYGGRHQTSVDTVNILHMPTQVQNNHNHWWGTQFEIDTGTTAAIGAYINSIENSLVDCRFEGAWTDAAVVLGTDSLRNYVRNARNDISIRDLGSSNTVDNPLLGYLRSNHQNGPRPIQRLRKTGNNSVVALGALTVDTTSGSRSTTWSAVTGLALGDYINIPGAIQLGRVEGISGTTVTFDTAAFATVAGAVPTRVQPPVSDIADEFINSTESYAQRLYIGRGGTASYFTRYFFRGTEMFNVNANGQLALPQPGTTGGVLFGGDAHLYRGAADVLELGTGDKFRPNQASQDLGDSTHQWRLFGAVVATGSLPAAAAAADGIIIIEDAGAGDRNLIIYAGGQRFRIDGGAPF